MTEAHEPAIGSHTELPAVRRPPGIASRMTLRDEFIERLPPAVEGRYTIWDEKLSAFRIDVGKKSRTFRVQIEAPKKARRLGSRRNTVVLTIGQYPEWTTRKARARATELAGQVRSGTDPRRPGHGADGPTLREAWVWYEERLRRKARSERTIESYGDRITRVLKDLLDLPLADIGRDPRHVSEVLTRIADRHGKYMSNGTARVLRAVYNYALDQVPEGVLPARNPVRRDNFYREERRDSGMSSADIQQWWAELQLLKSAIRRELHWFGLLSGLRRGDLRTLRWENVDLQKRLFLIPSPKGGTSRAFQLPISRAMARSLWRCRRASRLAYPKHAAEWVFASVDGHIRDIREVLNIKGKPERQLSKFGHELRASFATLATAAGIPEEIIGRLLNHRTKSVTAGYISDAALAKFYLDRMDKISSFIVECLRPEQRKNLI